jgi:methylated-DNA-[protein]-cysteine S-methyltransferase
MINYWIFPTARGDACIIAGAKGVKRLLLPGWDKDKIKDYIFDQFEDATPGSNPAPKKIKEAMNFVKNYLEGEAGKIPVELDLSDLREFQKKVLAAVSGIDSGQTRCYAWVAEQVGNPKAVRASAQAIARNPLPLFIPCHRVIGKDGSLTGFSAPSGLKLKKHLLELEKRTGRKSAR